MDTSLYIGNESLKAVGGRAGKDTLAVEHFAQVDYQSSTVVNGVVTNPDAMKACVDQLYSQNPWASRRQVHLVINSSQFITRRATLPRVGARALEGLVRAEFVDLEEPQEYLYDYTVLAPQAENGGMAALVCAVKRSFIADHIVAARELGIKLARINTPLPCVLNLADRMEIFTDKTCILLLLDGNILEAMLFVQGQYRYSNRQRLLADRASPDMVGEIGQTVSNLIQFNTSERSGFAITQLYVCGAGAAEEDLAEQTGAMFGLQAGRFQPQGNKLLLPQGFVLEDYLFPAGNLIR